MSAYYNENNPFAAQWLRSLIAAGLICPGDVDERSIVDVRADDLRGFTQCHFFAGIGGWSYALRLAGWPDDAPVWTGSCPCQPFSVAGKRRGAADERHLWPHFLPLIEQRSPPIVFGEQVAGTDGIAWADGVAQDFEKLSYAFASAVLPGVLVGAPQQRLRIYFVADATFADAGGRPADVRRNWRLQPMETSAWPPAVWERGNVAARGVDDGLPAQLVKGILRGMGNSIVPQLAAEFIAACSETDPR